MEEIKLNITSQNKDVIVRTGEALQLKEPLKIDIKGNIDAVSRFITQRNSVENTICAQEAIILVDREALSITLKAEPENFYGAIVKGELTINPLLQNFGINTGNKFTQSDLVSLLKLNRVFFADLDEHAKILSSIKNFKANVNKEIVSAKDGRGNNQNVNNQNITTDLAFDFKLNIPIFKGEKASVFMVEILLDITDAGTRFWLESMELNDLIINYCDTVINSNLKELQGFCIIEI